MKFSLHSLAFAAASIIGTLAVPTSITDTGAGLLSARSGTPSAVGLHNKFYYSWQTDNRGTAYYTNLDAGTYSVEWANSGTIVGGKGWNPGSPERVINYNGTYTPKGRSTLGVYGWTRNKLIEYYIVESFGGRRNPAEAVGAKHKGRVTCNGARYGVYSVWRYDQPSIEGTATFEQFWSVRYPKRGLHVAPGREQEEEQGRGRVRGTVDTACHFEAWRKLGMELGEDHSLQLFATEGRYSSGAATITVL